MLIITMRSFVSLRRIASNLASTANLPLCVSQPSGSPPPARSRPKPRPEVES